MADNVQLPLTGTGQGTANIAADDVGGVLYQRVKLSVGPDGSATDVSAIDPLPVEFAGALPAGGNNIGHVTVDNFPAVGVEQDIAPGYALVVAGTDGSNVQTLRLDANNSLLVSVIGDQNVAGTVTIQDGGSSITVDALSLPLPTGAATAALQTQPGVDIGDVTINNGVGAGAVNIQDGGNSITVDNAALSVLGGGLESGALRVTIASDSTGVVSIDDNSGSLTVDATSWPLPTGAATAALQTQPGVDIGDVTINNTAGAGAVNIQDGGNSITVDNPILSTVGGGTEASALRVTIANDSTGVVSIDDNGASLTVDGSVAITGLPAGANNIGDVDVLTIPGLSAGSNNIGTVNVASGLPTGANTIGAIASIVSGLPSGANTIGAVTVSGSVAVTGLPTGANNIGDVDVLTLPGLAASSNNIGDVDVLTMPGTVVEDAVSTGAEVAHLNAGIRNDNGITQTSANGDYGIISLDAAGRVGIADLGGSITVDGSVAVTGLPTGANNIGDVDVLTLPGLSAGSNNIGTVNVASGLPTGANTIGAIASIVAGLPTGANTIGAVTVSGSVAVTGLPAGANNIGDVDVLTLPGLAAGSNNIGTVNVSSGLPTGANTIGAIASIVAGLPTGANTIGSTTSTESIVDNAGFTDGTSRVFASGYVYDEVAGTALTENDIAAARINLNRAQVGVIEDGATRGRWATVTAANAVKVDGSAVTQPVSGSVAVTGLPTGANNIGDVDVLTLPGLAAGSNNIGTVNVASGLPTGANTIGAIASIVAGLPTGANNIGDVDVLTLPGLAASSNNIGDVDVLTLPGLPTGANTIGTVIVASTSNVAVQGTVAHDAIDAGNPQKIGAKAIAHGANPTAVAAADRTDLYANRHGILFTIAGHPNIQTVRTNITAAQTNVALVTVAGGLKIVVTRISVIVANSTSVDVSAVVGFGATTTPTTTGVVLAHPGIAHGSGIIEGNGGGILGIGGDGEDLRITSSVPTSGSVDVTVSYYTIES